MFDLPNCRYTALPDTVDNAFQRLARGQIETNDHLAELSAMVDAGLLIYKAGESTNLPQAVAQPACTSALDGPQSTTNLFLTIDAVLAQATTELGLKVKRLEVIFNRLQRDRTRYRPQPVSMAQLSSICSAFYWSERIISSGEKCLRRSIALVTYLQRKRIPCYLVIGVRMRPFAAHAWVQRGDLVLNETLDEVHRYTTILVV